MFGVYPRMAHEFSYRSRFGNHQVAELHVFVGGDASVGEKTLAAWMALKPRYGRAGDLRIPRSLRAIKGWRKVAPLRLRLPWPESSPRVWHGLRTDAIGHVVA